MHFTLRQLQVFLQTAQSQNLSQAARQLSMSQSAASNALKELEQQFQLQLFDRLGKRLRLNSEGERLRLKAQQIIDNAQELEALVHKQSFAGPLRLGATLTIGNYLAAPIMADFLALPGEPKLQLDIANTSTIAQQVISYHLDVGLIEGEYFDNKLVTELWREDQMVIVAHPQHQYAKMKILDDSHLQTLRWIMREPGSGTRQAFDHSMRGLLGSIDVHLVLQQTEAIKQAVKSNLGVACLSQLSVVEDLEQGRLVALAAPHRDWQRQLYIIRHKEKPINYASQCLLKICDQYRH